MTFADRLYEALNDVDDPFSVKSVAEAASTLLGMVAIGVGNIEGFGEPVDTLEVTRNDDDGVDMKAILKAPYEQWNDTSRVVVFSLLQDGFDYIVDEGAYVLELSIP